MTIIVIRLTDELSAPEAHYSEHHPHVVINIIAETHPRYRITYRHREIANRRTGCMTHNEGIWSVESADCLITKITKLYIYTQS